SGKEFIQPSKLANVFQLLHEEGREMSAWQIGKILSTNELLKPDRIEILERGSVRSIVQISHRFNESTFIQNVIVYHNLPRIDFPCTVDWREIGTRETGSRFLKVAFPLNISPESEATFEIPFGTIQREANGHEYPSQKWLDLSDEDFGVSLVNDCKYGCDVDQNVMRLSLLRCSYEPDPVPDKGMHHVAYAIVPHQGNWKSANTLKAGYELNQALIPMLTDQHQGHFPLSRPFVSCSAENVMITALKKCANDGTLILRCYETQGKSSDVTFRFSFNVLHIRETDLLERDLENSSTGVKDNCFNVGICPYEIRTFRITREAFQWQKRHNFVPV
ncbi:MAG TPA: glycoside hydrolase family 38 C-terminal domain-containing protein, partial [bacterium]